MTKQTHFLMENVTEDAEEFSGHSLPLLETTVCSDSVQIFIVLRDGKQNSMASNSHLQWGDVGGEGQEVFILPKSISDLR